MLNNRDSQKSAQDLSKSLESREVELLKKVSSEDRQTPKTPRIEGRKEGAS